jgi:hypothetical protein
MSSNRKKNTDLSTTGKQTLKEKDSSRRWLPADHPIFKRGIAIGVVRSTSSSKSTPATTSPSSGEPQAPSSNPPQIRKGIGSSIPEAPPDHPIYKRGFAIGIMRSIPSSKSTPEPTSPSSSEPQTLSSTNQPQQNDGEDSTPLA